MSNRQQITETRRVLVTGGCGFIGSALCRFLVGKGHRIVNVDRLTYAANPGSLEPLQDEPGYRFERLDIGDEAVLPELLRAEQIDAVVHLAAETHVDRSIASPGIFIETNVLGTFRLLETVRAYWLQLGPADRDRFRFHHVSTDEVFGDVALEEAEYTSVTRYRPSSPYSASKAASEHLVNAWHRTYGLPVLVSNSSNNYGPYQLPDKLVPRLLLNALEEQPLPIYGTGENIRDWLYVEDHVRALELVLSRGTIGESYHIGGRGTRSNLEVGLAICRTLDEMRPRACGRPYEDLITFVDDRPGHDRRYSIDPRRAEEELGWISRETFETGLQKTIDWYLSNPGWWAPLRDFAAYPDQQAIE